MFLKKSLKSQAKDVYKLNRDYLRQGPDDDVMKDIDTTPLPDMLTDEAFGNALIILKGSEEIELARRYLEQAKKINQHIHDHPEILKKSNTIGAYPRNLANCLRMDAYCDFFLGSGLDEEKLLRASGFYERFFNEKQAPNLDVPSEVNYYIWTHAIVTALLAGNPDRARMLIDNLPSPWQSSKVQVELLSSLVEFIRGELPKDRQSGFVREFGDYFDLIKDSRSEAIERQKKKYGADFDTEAVIGYVETAMLAQRYLENPGKPIEWRKVIDSCLR